MKKDQMIATTVALLLVIIIFLSGFFINSFLDARTSAVAEVAEGISTQEPESLVIDDIRTGDGPVAAPGTIITVHYTGTFPDGTVFDSSHQYEQPFTFELGAGSVINGWEIGLQGMREGGVRELTIPPGLAYGSEGRGPIPGGATIIFEIELLEVQQPQ